MPINWKIQISVSLPIKLLHATFPLHAIEPLQANDRSTMNCNFSYKSQIVQLFASNLLVVIDLSHTHEALS